MGSVLDQIAAPFKALAGRKGGKPLLILLVAGLLVFYLLSTRKELVPEERPERVWTVDVISASYADVRPELKLYGQVIAGRSSELRSQVAGRIVEVAPNYRDGGVVEAGELLLGIDPFDYETGLAEQQSILKEAEVALAKSRRNYERALELHAEKNVSDQFLDDAELDLRQQEARLEQQQIAVRRAERDLKETRVVAPFNGVISNVSAELGQRLSTNDMLAELIDLDKLEARFSLSNAQFGRLLGAEENVAGRPVRIDWEVGQEVLSFNGVISRAGAEISSSMGGVMVYASIDDTDRFGSIRPGALVSVSLADKTYKNVLQAPDSALYADGSVFLVEGDRLVRRNVDVQGFAGSQVLFVPAEGETIANGDKVVVTQLREAGVGALVEVRQ